MTREEILPYEQLANAIILQACSDYINADEIGTKRARGENTAYMVGQVEKFIKSQWFAELTKIDPQWLLKHLRQERMERLKNQAVRRITRFYDYE